MNDRPVALFAGSLRLEAGNARLRLLKRTANGFMYSSVILGVALPAQLYALMVPPWLFYSILAGWILYVVVAVGVATGRDKAYPPPLALSLATLVVSLPQPEHNSFTNAGPTLASLTFIAGSLLQIGVIVLITCFLVQRRKQFPAKRDC